jgi:hypothetical protein
MNVEGRGDYILMAVAMEYGVSIVGERKKWLASAMGLGV